MASSAHLLIAGCQRSGRWGCRARRGHGGGGGGWGGAASGRWPEPATPPPRPPRLALPAPPRRAGKTLAFDTTAAGAVRWHEADAGELAASALLGEAAAKRRPIKVDIPSW